MVINETFIQQVKSHVIIILVKHSILTYANNSSIKIMMESVIAVENLSTFRNTTLYKHFSNLSAKFSRTELPDADASVNNIQYLSLLYFIHILVNNKNYEVIHGHRYSQLYYLSVITCKRSTFTI